MRSGDVIEVEGDCHMAKAAEVTLRLVPGPDDVEELDEPARNLSAELLELDVLSVDPVAPDDVPAHAKGLGAIAGWIAVKLGSAEALRAVIGAARSWSLRSGRTVEITIGTDVLKLTGATAQQQEKLVEVWLARQSITS